MKAVCRIVCSSASPSLKCTGYSDTVRGYPYQQAPLQIHPQTHLDLWHPTLGHSIHIQHRDTRTLSLKSPAHNRRCTVLCAEQSHPSGPPDDLYSTRLTTHPNDQILTLMEIPGVCDDTYQTICPTDFYCNCCTCNSSF
jgi:hypothetical protein